jgi:hypothetical protein
MNEGQLIFSQVINLLYRTQFDRCIEKYPMPRKSRSLSARDHFLVMAFAQLTFRESLRDIEACLSQCSHLYAMGIRGNITRTNLAYANENRDWRTFEELAKCLIGKARKLYADDSLAFDVDELVYAIDSSTIDLCLSKFPWATFRKTKSAIKLHTMIDLKGSIPVFIDVSDGNVHDVNLLDKMKFEAGSIYAMDRGYVDFNRLNYINEAGSFFVTRAKKNMNFSVISSATIDKETGLRCDQVIRLKGLKSKEAYPHKFRRIRYKDSVTGKSLVFITNNFKVLALTVTQIYKSRWHIELFFKWIKQNLRIKTFYGNSENAVKTQIWIAICTYLLVAILKKTLGLTESLSRILQVLSVNVFQKEPVYQLFEKVRTRSLNNENSNQLLLNIL